MPTPFDGLGFGSFVTGPRGSYGGGSPSYSGIGTPTAAVPENLASIVNLINNLNRTAQQQNNAARIPNALDLEAQSSLNIGSELGGEIPEDVLRVLRQGAAERGVSRGLGGSPFENADYLRSLGLTSLDLQDKGQQHLTAALGRNPITDPFDPTGLILTPYQSGQLAADDARLKLEQERLALERWKAERGNYYQNMQALDSYGPKEYSYALLNAYGAGGVPSMGASPSYVYRYWM